MPEPDGAERRPARSRSPCVTNGEPNELVLEPTDDAEIVVDLRAERPGPALEIPHARMSLALTTPADLRSPPVSSGVRISA